jgi:cell division septal protein FtsQ
MTRVIWADAEARSVSEQIMSRRRRRGRSSRRDTMALPWRAVTMVLLAAAGLIAVWSLRVNEIEVSGLAVADAGRAQLALQPALQQRWLLVDASALARSLEIDPWIERAEVSRALPSGLSVRLQEARPCYRLEEGSAVDERGRVLPRRDAVDLGQLPLLEGVVPDAGGALGSATEAVREFSAALREVPWTWEAGLSRIVVGPTREVDLFTGEGTRIQLGRRDFRRRLQRLAAVHERLGDPSASIDLRFERQVVVGNSNVPAGG